MYRVFSVPMGRKRVPWRERYKVSRQILGQSVKLVSSMRSYWVFPLAAFGAMLVWFAAIISIMLLGGAQEGSVFGIDNKFAIFGLVMVSVFPFMVFLTLMNSALAYGVYQELQGEPVAIRTAWRRTLSQIGPLIRFSVIGFVVGVFVAVVGQFLDKLRIIPGIGTLTQIIGALGWAAASFFVIPILIVERQGRVKDALKESVSLARDNWGKSVSGIVTIILAVAVPYLVIAFTTMFVVFAIGITAMQSASTIAEVEAANQLWSTLMFVLLGVVIVLGGIASMLIQTTQTAYQTGLYVHTKTGEVQPPFTEGTLVDAWEPYRSS